jgi:hypothetical protein
MISPMLTDRSNSLYKWLLIDSLGNYLELEFFNTSDPNDGNFRYLSLLLILLLTLLIFLTLLSVTPKSVKDFSLKKLLKD